MKATHILWATHNRNHWEIAAKGTFEECEQQMEELGNDGHEIHKNEIKDSWDNEVEGIHYDTYMDGTTESRPMHENEFSLLK